MRHIRRWLPHFSLASCLAAIALTLYLTLKTFTVPAAWLHASANYTPALGGSLTTHMLSMDHDTATWTTALAQNEA